MPIDSRRILFEDDQLLIVNKRGGELVVKGAGKVDKLPLLDYLKQDYPGLVAVHRLDFETSGIVVFAKSKATLKKIVDSKFGNWEKVYEAIVTGVPKKTFGMVTKEIESRSGKGKVETKTKYQVIKKLKEAALVELSFERGQKHQIRIHMQKIGHPLLLDERYGDRRVNQRVGRRLKMRRFFLHASRISFPHPETGETVEVTCKRPQPFERALEKLGL